MTADDKAALESIRRLLDRLTVDLESVQNKYKSFPYKYGLISSAMQAKNDLWIRMEAALDD